MGEIFEMIAALVLLSTPVAMVVGLIKPAWLRLPNRKMVMVYTGGAFLFMFMVVGVIANDKPKDAAVNDSAPVLVTQEPLQREEVERISARLQALHDAGVDIQKSYDFDDMDQLRACVQKNGHLRDEAKALKKAAMALNRMNYRASLATAADDAFVCAYCGASDATAACSSLDSGLDRVKADLKKEPEQQTMAEVKPATPEFMFNLDEFIVRYNQAFDTLGIDIRTSLKKENDNGKYITAMLTSNSSIGLIVTANNRTRAVQSIMMQGISDGTVLSEANITVGEYAVVMAIENPLMPRAERVGIGFVSDEYSKTNDLKLKRHGVSYHLTYSSVIGTTLIAEPVQ